jgi:hypothetical protein
MHAPHATANCLSEIPQPFFFTPRFALCALRALRAPHTRTLCSRHVPFVYSLRFCNFFQFCCSTLHDVRAARAAHSRIALAAAAPPCSIHVLSCFKLFLPLRACAGRLRCHNCARSARSAYAHADPQNLCRLPQCVFVPIGVSSSPAVWAPTLDM